jgi:hypothetical protein
MVDRVPVGQTEGMAEPIEFQNDVPMLERGLALFFAAVGAPIVWLVWTEPDAIPWWAASLFGLGAPVFLVAYLWHTFVRRVRARVVLTPGSLTALVERRRLWHTTRGEATIIDASLDVRTDIDGDPYGRLNAHLADGTVLTLSEGTGVDRLRTELERVRAWMS